MSMRKNNIKSLFIQSSSSELKKLFIIHLETFFIGTATGEILEEYIMKALNNGNIPIEKLLMLGSDGPYVNKKVFRFINENIKIIRGMSLIEHVIFIIVF
jgi:hypothetical protein